ncbi:hypothetical protein ACU4HD_10590 [Cupriavidus basilensis]
MQRAPFIQRPQTQEEMHHQRAVQDSRPKPSLPDELLHKQATLQPSERDIPQRVIQEMRTHVGKQHQSGGKADRSHTGRPQPLKIGKVRHALPSTHPDAPALATKR